MARSPVPLEVKGQLANGFLAAVAPVKHSFYPLAKKLQCPIQHPSLVKLRADTFVLSRRKAGPS